MRKRVLSIGAVVVVLLLFLFVTVKLNNDTNNFCANSISCIKDLTGIYDKTKFNAEFEGKTFSAPYEVADIPLATNVLGDSTANKRIEIDLTNQRLYAYEGDAKVYDFLVSTGKWGKTPTGTFDIWIKLRYTKMEGGNKDWGTYYYLPNVPYVMFFHNEQVPKWRGYGIHGTYWHSNFGHPMSHGCINMKTEEVEKLYYWANPPSTKNTTYASNDNPGTKIIIYGEAPNE